MNRRAFLGSLCLASAAQASIRVFTKLPLAVVSFEPTEFDDDEVNVRYIAIDNLSNYKNNVLVSTATDRINGLDSWAGIQTGYGWMDYFQTYDCYSGALEKFENITSFPTDGVGTLVAVNTTETGSTYGWYDSNTTLYLTFHGGGLTSFESVAAGNLADGTVAVSENTYLNASSIDGWYDTNITIYSY